MTVGGFRKMHTDDSSPVIWLAGVHEGMALPLRTALEKSGYEVIQVIEEEQLDWVPDHEPALILLGDFTHSYVYKIKDIMQSRAAVDSVPVIVLIEEVDQDFIEQAYSWGVVDCYPKEVELTRLLKRVRDACSYYDLRRQLHSEEEKCRGLEATLRQEKAGKYKAIAEAVTSAVFIIQGEKFIYINPIFEDQTGYSPEETEAINFWDIMDLESQQLVKARGLARQKGESVPARYEIKIRTKRGEIIWWDYTATSIQYEDSPAILGVAFDITQRKIMEDALKESEKALQTLLDNALDAIFVHDVDGRISVVNQTMLNLYGVTREEAVVFNIKDYSAPENPLDTISRTWQQVFKGQTRHFEWIAVRPKDGYKFPVDVRLCPINLSGQDKIMAMVRDITARKQAEEAVQVLMSNVVDGIFVHDVEGRLVYVNQKMLEMFDQTVEQAMQLTVFDFSTEDNPLKIIKYTWREVLEGKIVNFEWMCRRPKDGSTFPVEVYLRRIELRGQDYVMAMVRDISARREAESLLQEALQQLALSYQKLQDANDELEEKVASRTQELQAINEELTAMNDSLVEANQNLAREIDERRRVEAQLAYANMELSQTLENVRKMQDQLVQTEKMASLGTLVAGVAHEINSPVGVSVTAASHLEKIIREFVSIYDRGSIRKAELENFLEDSQEAVLMVLSNLERASRLIKSFKQVSVDQSSEDRRVFNVKRYLEEIVISLQPQYKKARHIITIHCAEDINLDSYPGAFSQIITNLLMNSFSHAFDQDTAGHIIVNVQYQDRGISLVYRDNGRGMSKEILEHMYDPFFTTKRGAGGTGLGMYVVYNLVTQQFHGSIQCESTPEAGTAYTIQLNIGG